MAITAMTDNPRALLEAVIKAIREGHIDTWQYKEGYFTHSPAQWRFKAFLKPSTDARVLMLNIVRPANGNVSSEVYAVYHGRFIEMLLAHFDRLFDSALASAMAVEADIV
jgi:hypothetical protein